MPELPEVEISARVARRGIEAREVMRVELTPCKIFRLPRAQPLKPLLSEISPESELIIKPDQLQVALEGARAHSSGRASSRFGKLMALHFLTSDHRVLTLFSRLGMTGKWVRVPTNDPEAPLPRSGVKLALTTRRLTDDITHEVGTSAEYEHLLFINTRMFGAIWGLISRSRVEESRFIEVAESQFQVEVAASEMGPDALKLASEPRAWVDHLRGQRPQRKVKTLLLDQRVVAGVGNIYAAEGIFRAGAHPLAPLKTLSDHQLTQIAEGIAESMFATLKSAEGEHEVLYGSARGEQSPFSVYGREGLECTTCSTTLINLTVSGRATVLCPSCQPLTR